MIRRFNVKTPFGTSILREGDKLYVQLKDGSYAPLSVEKAQQFGGKSRTIFLTDKLDVPFSEYEVVLMGVKEGDFAAYRISKERLHEQINSTFVPRLTTNLNAVIPEDKRTNAVTDLHKIISEYSERNTFEPVTRGTIFRWLGGDAVLPVGKNLLALAYSCRQLGLSVPFIERAANDFQEYDESNKKMNDVEENLWYAHAYYSIVRSVLGKMSNNFSSGSNKNEKKRNDSYRIEKVDTSKLRAFVSDFFCKYVDAQRCEVPLLEITESIEKKDPPSLVYIVKSENNDVNVPKKMTRDVVRDVALLERAFLDQVYTAVYHICEEKGFDYNFISYVACSLEDRLRNSNSEKGIFGLNKEGKKIAESMTTEISNMLFNSEEGNRLFDLEKGSFKRFRDAHKLLMHLFPKSIETYVLAQNNAHILNYWLSNSDIFPMDAEKRRETELRRDKHTNLCYENMVQALQMHLDFELKYIPTEKVVNYIYLFNKGMLDSNETFQTLKRGMKRNDLLDAKWRAFKLRNRRPESVEQVLSLIQNPDYVEPYYEEQDFINVLHANNLDEFIPREYNIALWRSLKPKSS